MRNLTVALASALLAVNACSGNSSNDYGPGGAAAATPTWTGVYTSVISKRCLPCHATGIGAQDGHLDMSSQPTAYANLVNVPAAGVMCGGQGTRVVPGEPDSSILYLKISLDDPSPCGAKMPYQLPALSQVEADLIDTWITKGAKDD